MTPKKKKSGPKIWMVSESKIQSKTLRGTEKEIEDWMPRRSPRAEACGL